MTATSDLRSEHQGVGRMLGIMDAMAGIARDGGRLDVGDLTQMIEFLRVFVDKCHHAKEEQLLFPAIAAANLTAVQATVDILMAEHAQGREAVAAIASATERLEAGDDTANAEFATLLPSYTHLLHAHIRREENDCFGPADRELPAAVQAQLDAGYDRIERDVVGEGIHEAFHALLDRMSVTYGTGQ